MKRLSTGVLAALIAALCGFNAVAAPSMRAQGNTGNSVAQGGGHRRRTSDLRRPARFRFSITIITSTASPTSSSRAACWRRW